MEKFENTLEDLRVKHLLSLENNQLFKEQHAFLTQEAKQHRFQFENDYPIIKHRLVELGLLRENNCQEPWTLQFWMSYQQIKFGYQAVHFLLNVAIFSVYMAVHNNLNNPFFSLSLTSFLLFGIFNGLLFLLPYYWKWLYKQTLLRRYTAKILNDLGGEYSVLGIH